MVVFDATILLAFLQSDCPPPRHPETNEPIDSFRERIDYLIQRLDKDKEKIIIPSPALSEILVRQLQRGRNIWTGSIQHLYSAPHLLTNAVQLKWPK